jgi:hypothetical protein
VLVIPSLHYQTSPIATIPPSSFADLFNTHLLHPILTIQAFLPLLTSRLDLSHQHQQQHQQQLQQLHHQQPEKEKHSPPKVLILTPSIISSINPPFHAPEATICSAMSAFTEVLAGELRPLGVAVTHVQLGTFDFSAFAPSSSSSSRTVPGLLPAAGPDHAESLSWPEGARQAYGRNFVRQGASVLGGGGGGGGGAGRARGLRGSSPRELHRVVFDVLDGSEAGGVVRVGLGASVYGLVGRWAPRGLVAWMMGVRRVDELATWQQQQQQQQAPGAGVSVGERSGSESGDFVAVPLGHLMGGGTEVWREDG